LELIFPVLPTFFCAAFKALARLEYGFSSVCFLVFVAFLELELPAHRFPAKKAIEKNKTIIASNKDLGMSTFSHFVILPLYYRINAFLST